MRQEKLKPLACDILLSAGISVTDRCSISPSPLMTQVPTTAEIISLHPWPQRGLVGDNACSHQPGNPSLFPLPLWHKMGVWKGQLSCTRLCTSQEGGWRKAKPLIVPGGCSQRLFFYYCFVSILFHQTHSKQAFCLPLMKSASISKVLFAGCNLSPSPI